MPLLSADSPAHQLPATAPVAACCLRLAAPFKLIRALSPLFRDAAKAEQEASGAASARSIINISSSSGTHGNSGQVGAKPTLCCTAGLSADHCDASRPKHRPLSLVPPLECAKACKVTGQLLLWSDWNSARRLLQYADPDGGAAHSRTNCQQQVPGGSEGFQEQNLQRPGNAFQFAPRCLCSLMSLVFACGDCLCRPTMQQARLLLWV